MRSVARATDVNQEALLEAVWDLLRSVEDPELPITITDLGLVRDVQAAGGRVLVRLIPTWTACPALAFIRQRVQEGLLSVAGVREASVEYTYDEPWTLERMTEQGRQRLREYGLSVPLCRFAEPPICPYCGSRDVALDSPFGPTLCRAMYLCRACRNPFERFKPPAESSD